MIQEFLTLHPPCFAMVYVVHALCCCIEFTSLPDPGHKNNLRFSEVTAGTSVKRARRQLEKQTHLNKTCFLLIKFSTKENGRDVFWYFWSNTRHVFGSAVCLTLDFVTDVFSTIAENTAQQKPSPSS